MPVPGAFPDREGPKESSRELASREGLLLRLRILIVDDDEGCLESVESLLELEGHSIVTATRGNEALDVARRLREDRQRLDLSILDFNMPDLTGLETFQRLELEMPGTPAIFISGNATAAMESMVRTAGARALVSKPLDAFLLRSMVREVVRKQGFGGGGVN